MNLLFPPILGFLVQIIWLCPVDSKKKAFSREHAPLPSPNIPSGPEREEGELEDAGKVGNLVLFGHVGLSFFSLVVLRRIRAYTTPGIQKVQCCIGPAL